MDLSANFSNEIIEKAKKASSKEELLELANAEGIEITEAEAEKYFSFLHGSGELTDDELSQVAGGKGRPGYQMVCSTCGHEAVWRQRCMNVICPCCGHPTFSAK